jgi:selenide,water dikinase
MTTRRLVLVGGGHAHLYVLRELARRPIADVEAVLVTAGDHYFSSMVPGYLQGQYDVEELRIDLLALARRAGVRVVRAVAERVDVEEKVVIAGGERIPFDVCSLDVGREEAPADTPGVAAHAIALRPAARAVELRERLDELIATATRPLAVVVVGGRAEGVEVALALRHHLGASAAGGTVTLVERGTEVLGEFEPPMRRLAAAVLQQRGVSLALGGRVTTVSGSAVTLHNGASLPTDLVVWLGGAAAPPLVLTSGLACDDEGYLLVDRALRAADGAPVWGAGDCVRVKDFPAVAKAPVYAVREAPVLERSLRAALGKGRAGRYRPQRSSLVLLNTGGGWSLMRWKGIHRHARWAWRLKDMIDRRFMRRYQVSDEKGRSAS